MIVRMKKASIITRKGDRQSALSVLRKLGVLHISDIPAQVPSAQEWKDRKLLVERALTTLAIEIKPMNSAGAEVQIDKALKTAQDILNKQEALRLLSEELENLKKEEARLLDWEGIAQTELKPILERGFDIRFYELPQKQLDQLPPSMSRFVVKRDKAIWRIALIMAKDSSVESELKPVLPPQRGTVEISKLLKSNNAQQEQLRLDLNQLKKEAETLQATVTALTREIELAEAAAAMGHTESLTYLRGFLPSDQIDILKNACRQNGWALLLQNPDSEDEVPTIVRNKRWIDIIGPVFQLLGTVPGYREFDISFFFLLFFAFFFAVIIGDAGYGLVLLSGTLVFTLRLRQKGQDIPNALLLMLMMSLSTMIWGALTGSWFGSEQLGALPWLSWMTIPAIATFNPQSSETIKYICFITGTIHISIAHLWNFFRQIKEKPMIRAFAQLGWLFLVLGLYYLVLSLVLSSGRFPLPIYAKWLMAVGLTFIIVFSQQEGRFFHGIFMGIANLLTTFLNSISAFSDIISYIRLFAVGLATVEIAKSFNAMASGMANGAVGIILASIVLLLGHSLNLAMGALSVVVHGVRLNMLEFSGHLGMEWTGRPYKPFKE